MRFQQLQPCCYQLQRSFLAFTPAGVLFEVQAQLCLRMLA
jgi:hypothetical protein